MRGFALSLLLAFTGCSSGGPPDYSAIICLEDRNQEHLIEQRFAELFKQNGYRVDRLNYGAGKFARGSFGRFAFVEFLGPTKPDHSAIVWGNMYADSDDEGLTDFKDLMEKEWGGFPVSVTGITMQECAPEAEKL